MRPILGLLSNRRVITVSGGPAPKLESEESIGFWADWARWQLAREARCRQSESRALLVAIVFPSTSAVRNACGSPIESSHSQRANGPLGSGRRAAPHSCRPKHNALGPHSAAYTQACTQAISRSSLIGAPIVTQSNKSGPDPVPCLWPPLAPHRRAKATGCARRAPREPPNPRGPTRSSCSPV